MKKLILILVGICTIFSTTYAYSLTKVINTHELTSSVLAESDVRVRYNDIKGYTFNGWEAEGIILTGNNYKDITFKMPENDVTLEAKLTLTNYEISYELNGGTADNQTSYTINDMIVLNEPTKGEYIFLGWTGSNGSIPQKNVIISKGNSGNKFYIANWKSKVYEIEVTQTGKGTITSEMTTLLRNNVNIFEIAENESLTFKFKADNEYEILDVKLNGISLGIMDEYTFNKITTNQTLYVEFSDSQEFTFTSKINNVTESFKVSENESISVTALPKAGYRFVNWTTTGITLPNTETVVFTMPKNDVTIVANYELE